MAFVDTLLSDTKATVALVDRYARPGGHGPLLILLSAFTSPLNFMASTLDRLVTARLTKSGSTKAWPSWQRSMKCALTTARSCSKHFFHPVESRTIQSMNI